MSVAGPITSLKVKPYTKEDAAAAKRKENQLRIKKLREEGFSKNRDIQPNLELTDDSIQEGPIKVTQKKSTVFQKKKKPPRLELLKQWREQKQLEKEKSKAKQKKPQFVVKHLKHEDKDIFGYNQSYYVEASNKQTLNATKRANTLRSHQRLDASRITHGVNKEAKKKQSSLRERSQINGRGKDGTRRQPPRSCKSKLFENDETMIGRLSIEDEKMMKSPTSRTNNKSDNLEIVKDNLLDMLGLQNQTSMIRSCKEDGEKENEVTNRALQSNCIDYRDNKIIDDSCNVHDGSFEHFLSSTRHPINQTVSPQHEFQAPTGLGYLDFQFNKENLPLESNKDIEMNCSPIKTGSPHHQNKHLDKVLTDCATTPLVNNRNKTLPKTPVSLFKDKLNLSTNHSPSSRRNSLTPNPKNFLSMSQDPVTLRLSSPFVSKKSPCAIPNETMRVVQEFTNKVEFEESKFRAYIECWENVMKETDTPESVHGDILSAIGQAQLLMRKRFKQFKELIELHKDTTAEKAAHASDLDGFWEMVYIQVDDVHERFGKLENLRKMQWNVEEVRKPENIKPAQKKIVKKPKPTVGKPSKARSDFKKFRQQMLAKKKAEEEKMFVSEDVISEKEEINETRPIKVDLLSSFNESSGNVELTPTKSVSEGPSKTTTVSDDLMLFSP